MGKRERTIQQFPHCDPQILHAPGECTFCDMHPDWQELREVWKINFTGHHLKNRRTCPAEMDRPVETIHKWHGNRPMTEEALAQAEREMDELTERLKKDFPEQFGDERPGHVAVVSPTWAQEILADPNASSADIKRAHAATMKIPDPNHDTPAPYKVTLSGKPADPGYQGPAPQDIEPATGMHKDYWVLSEQERAKGFVRPVRRTYMHETCGNATTMAQAIAETYARNPHFYGATFCVHCKGHFPVGSDGEFIWMDGSKVGT